jgi:hypothetical protein
MKKTLLTFLLFPFLAHSQTTGYLPLEIGNAWFFNNSTIPAIQVVGDSLFHGHTYRKLSCAGLYGPDGIGPFVRVDSGKVYEFNSYTGTDLLLYEFSKVAGDTLYSDTAGRFQACYENKLVQFTGRTLREWVFGQGAPCADCASGETIVDSIGWIDFSGANYTLRLSKVILGGTTIITDVALSRESKSISFDATVYPNPFNSSAILKYGVPRPGKIRIALFNSLGQQVKVLLDALANPGSSILTIDGSTLASGIYYCRLSFENNVLVKKVVLLK